MLVLNTASPTSMVGPGADTTIRLVRGSSFIVSYDAHLRRCLTGGSEKFEPRMLPSSAVDGVYRSDRGRFRILNPSNESQCVTNVGHLYLWPICANHAERQSWQLIPRQGGYVFYNDFDGGMWLAYNKPDDFMIAVKNTDDATIWKIDPTPNSALVVSSV